MRREDRSSISFHPLADLGGKRVVGPGYVIDISYRVQFLCSCREAVHSSRPALVPRRRAQAAVKTGRRAWLASGSGVSRPRL